MAELVRHIPPDTPRSASSHGEPAREWLVANGVGGYASGTVTGQATRRYHGLLIAALPVPLGRWLLLSHLSERVRLSDGHVAALGGALPGDGALVQARTTFRMEQGLPVWEYALAGVRLEKRVLMAHTQNTTYVIYRLLEGTSTRLKLLPAVHSRPHDAPVNTPLPGVFRVSECDSRYEVATGDTRTIRLKVFGKIAT